MIDFGVWVGQWFVLIRKHAEKIVTDSLVFPVFQNHCKVYLFLDLALPVFGQLLISKENKTLPRVYCVFACQNRTAG
jgi:hypothetical protein